MGRREIEVAIKKALLLSEEDLILRFPEPDDAFLDPNATYEKEISINNKRLVYLAYDIPEGVVMNIYRDSELYYWAYGGEIGALQMKNGILFNNLKIRVENKSSITQKWSITMIFV